jgi:DNA repair protein RadA/Sms
MAKEKIKYVCGECGYTSAKWLGRCVSCGAWNSFSEEEEKKIKIQKTVKNIEAHSFENVEVEADFRYVTKLGEFDRVLGGGLVKGEVVLITGSPGIGKSTLLLQVSKEYTSYGKVAYISGEESIGQIKYRAGRLGIESNNLFVINETEVKTLCNYISNEKIKVVVIDSIQTLYNDDYDAIPGTPTQIRESTLEIINLAKSSEISVFIVGHITKDGKVAGPKLLEHMVDAVLNFEGEENNYYRILRSQKNRFGSTNEIGIFNMETDGIKEIKNPSEFFLSERDEKNIGSLVVTTIEGSKVFLLEAQALLVQSNFGMPRRVVQGFDKNKIEILCAIIEKKMGINLGMFDLFINIPGGIYIKDTSGDLAIAMAMMSAIKDIEVSQKIAAIGEIGLRGEIRKVSFIQKRLRELEKLGFKGVYVPDANKKEIEKENYDLKIIYLKNLTELMERMK